MNNFDVLKFTGGFPQQWNHGVVFFYCYDLFCSEAEFAGEDAWAWADFQNFVGFLYIGGSDNFFKNMLVYEEILPETFFCPEVVFLEQRFETFEICEQKVRFHQISVKYF